MRKWLILFRARNSYVDENPKAHTITHECAEYPKMKDMVKLVNNTKKVFYIGCNGNEVLAISEIVE